MKNKLKNAITCITCGQVDNDRDTGTSVTMHCPDCAAPATGRATQCRKCCSTNHGTFMYQPQEAL